MTEKFSLRKLVLNIFRTLFTGDTILLGERTDDTTSIYYVFFSNYTVRGYFKSFFHIQTIWRDFIFLTGDSHLHVSHGQHHAQFLQHLSHIRSHVSRLDSSTHACDLAGPPCDAACVDDRRRLDHGDVGPARAHHGGWWWLLRPGDRRPPRARGDSSRRLNAASGWRGGAGREDVTSRLWRGAPRGWPVPMRRNAAAGRVRTRVSGPHELTPRVGDRWLGDRAWREEICESSLSFCFICRFCLNSHWQWAIRNSWPHISVTKPRPNWSNQRFRCGDLRLLEIPTLLFTHLLRAFTQTSWVNLLGPHMSASHRVALPVEIVAGLV